jgi:outer membrane protein assembly factor BamB
LIGTVRLIERVIGFFSPIGVGWPMMSSTTTRNVLTLSKVIERLLLSLPLSFSVIGSAWADDWPGLLGSQRDGHADSSTALSSSAPPGVLSTAWKLDAGQGYAGMAIADGKAVLFDRDGDSDRIRSVDATNGKVLWERSLPANYRGGIDSDKGPRCVPTITSRFIVVYSAAGDLSVLAKEDGKVLWTRPLRKETNADDGYFGAGSTPLVLRDRIIIVNVGGKKAGVIAISLNDGKDLWRATDYDASYASPIAVQLPSDDAGAGASMVVVPTRLKTIGLELDSGKLLWETPFGQRGPTVNAATPIQCKNGELFLTASYDVGNVTLRAKKSSVEIVHQGAELFSQYATPVYVNGWIYGSDGREDMGSGGYKCLDPLTGRVAWEVPQMPICHTIAIGTSQLLLVGIDGQVWLLHTSPEKFSVIWKSKLEEGVYRALPAFANNYLFVRTNGRNNQWQAFKF